MTAKDYVFSENITHREKFSKYSVVDPSKKVPDLNFEVQDLLLEVVDLKQEVSDLRSGVIPPPNLPPASYKQECDCLVHFLSLLVW